MKRIATILLVLVLVLSMFTVTATAALSYDYQKHIFKDMYGGTFTFSAADHGYGALYYYTTGERFISPLIVVENGSLVTYRNSNGAGSEYHTGTITKTYSGMRGKPVVTDYKELTAIIGESSAENVFSFDISTGAAIETMFPEYESGTVNDEIMFLHADGGLLAAVMTESAARSFSRMVEDDGPVLKEQNEVISFDEGYMTEEGYAYDFTIKNTGSEDMNGIYALLTCHDGQHKDVYGAACYGAQLTVMNIELEAGDTMTGSLISEYGELTWAKSVWIGFETQEEYDAFIINEALKKVDNSLGGHYVIEGSAAKSFILEKFGIAI